MDPWGNLRRGSIVVLNDQMTLMRKIEAGLTVGPEQREIKDVYDVREAEAGIRWVLCNLGDGEFLMLKTCKGEHEFRRYTEIRDESFEEGDRQDMLDAGRLWLFQDPGKEDFNLDELVFTDKIDYEDKGAACEFWKKPQGVRFARVNSGHIAQVVEYKANVQMATSEMLLMELGGEKTDRGGLIMLLIGAAIRDTEVQVLG